MSPNPILVEVVRSGYVESVHRGSLYVLGPSGSVVHEAGTPEEPCFPRSAVKPLQALAMLGHGLDVDDRALALATASHSGEPDHVELVRAVLAGGGFTPEDLQCPPDLPLNVAAAHAVLAAGGGPARILMNCSGKHAAMLRTCGAAGWPADTYLRPDHPVQRAAADLVAELSGESVAATGVDGCGAPLFGMTLRGVAAAYSALTRAPEGTPARRVADVMRAHPWYVAGTGRDDTELMRAVPGLLMKGGAEGVHAAALPDGSAIALKIDDGATRARMPVMVSALRLLGTEVPAFDEWVTGEVLGGGRRVGEVRLRPGAL